MIHTGQYSSPLGEITLSGNDEALTGLWFSGQKYFGSTLPPHVTPGETESIRAAKRWLDAYFMSGDPGAVPPLDMRGTPFQRAVWSLLLAIPYGHTVTYGQLAAALAARMGRAHMSAQAVGSAVGRNPVSVLVPCHRVVGADGSLTGYAGGIWRKRELLRLEQAALCAPEKGTVQ